MGGTWWTDPVTDTTAVLLADLVWPSPPPPAVFDPVRAAASGTRTPG